MTKTKLINGFLPPHTKCPLSACPCVGAGIHKGEEHPTRFSCALVRGFALTTEGREKIETVENSDPAYSIRPVEPS